MIPRKDRTIRASFNYSCTAPWLTNRKHRSVTGSIELEPDTDFELTYISFECGRCPSPLLLRLGEPTVPAITIHSSSDAGIPIFPAIIYKASGSIQFSVSLPEGANIGRKRPRFTLWAMGYKIHPKP